MRFYDLIDPYLLQQHLENKMISHRKHPTLPLHIYNYTHKAQYEPTWGDGVIDYCRGLIVNDDYEIVSRPFKKFHNLNTLSIPETMFENLPLAPFFTAEKLDGSLGIYYDDGDGGAVASRGSFTSEQAKFATRWFKENIFHSFWYEHETPLFEIIYPENRIVVDYGAWAGLRLIGLMNKETGIEVPWPMVAFRAAGVIAVPKDYSHIPLYKILGIETENSEGFVITFSTGLKVKVKMKEYQEIHRVVSGTNPRVIWEKLKSDQPLIERKLPEKFKEWLAQWTSKLKGQFYDLYTTAHEIFANRPINCHDSARKYRTACAEYFKTAAGDRTVLLPLLFGLFDNRDITEMIWDLIEPRGDDKSFIVEGE